MSLAQALQTLKTGADQVIETSCATVILKGDQAYKIKKSVDFGFLDFTTVEKRRNALKRELDFNRLTAPDIYRDVIEIEGESILVMRRFDTSSVMAEWSQIQGWAPRPELMQDLGETIATFHAQAEVCRDGQHIENLNYVIGSNSENMSLFTIELGAETVLAYDIEIVTAFESIRPVIHQRFGEGHVRRCHGDLHLGNILIENGRPILFDCIEFNERLSQIDVLYDLGFLLMDLWIRGLRAEANRVMNAWLEKTARLKGEAGLYEGLALLPLYMSVRAGVRCHVSAHNGEMDLARQYLQAARDLLKPIAPSVSAIGGLSGAGKSTYARTIAPDRGRAPGAVVLRSDELRKRLWNWPSFEALPSEAYTGHQTARTYEHMAGLAGTVLRAGQSVILDATFREKAWRDRAEQVSSAANAHFEGIWLSVDAETRRRRVDSRADDVSDATAEVVNTQEDVELSSISWQISVGTRP